MDAQADRDQRDQLIDEPDYQPIEMPVNTPTGVICAFFASLCGFALIWYIWWLAILGLVGAFAVFVWYAWRDEHEHVIPVEEVIGRMRASGGGSARSTSSDLSQST